LPFYAHRSILILFLFSCHLCLGIEDDNFHPLL
jgi:hypothetical protein